MQPAIPKYDMQIVVMIIGDLNAQVVIESDTMKPAIGKHVEGEPIAIW